MPRFKIDYDRIVSYEVFLIADDEDSAVEMFQDGETEFEEYESFSDDIITNVVQLNEDE